MKKSLLLTAALTCALGLAGCNSYNPQDRAVGGAAIGAASGAAIGAASGGGAGGTIAGAVLGAAAGGIIGANTAPPPPPRRCAEFMVDDYGYRHCTAWY